MTKHEAVSSLDIWLENVDKILAEYDEGMGAEALKLALLDSPVEPVGTTEEIPQSS